MLAEITYRKIQLFSFVTHVRYKCARTAVPIPTPSSARRIGIERGGNDLCGDSRPRDRHAPVLGCLTYCTLQPQFQLDETSLEALKDETLYGQQLAVDEGGRVLPSLTPGHGSTI
jgi:hypothetical protein